MDFIQHSLRLLKRFLAICRRTWFCFLRLSSLWKASVLSSTDELNRSTNLMFSRSLVLNLHERGAGKNRLLIIYNYYSIFYMRNIVLMEYCIIIQFDVCMSSHLSVDFVTSNSNSNELLLTSILLLYLHRHLHWHAYHHGRLVTCHVTIT